MRIPIDKVLEVASKALETASSMSEGLVVCVVVDPKVPRWLGETVRDALVPQMGTSTVSVQATSDFAGPVAGCNLGIVLTGGSDDAAVLAALRSFARAEVPCAVCAETSLEVPEAASDQSLAAVVSQVVGSEKDALLEKLCDWMLDSANPVAVSANFEFCRETETERLIQRCAMANAAVGTVNILHGADLPIMAANQAKLALDLAAAHGEGMSTSRMVEMAAVMAAAVAYRGVARTLCDRVRPLSFAIRGSVGYAGSLATGTALALRFGERPGFAAYALELLEDALAAAERAGTESGEATGHAPQAMLANSQVDDKGTSDGESASSGASSDGYIVLQGGGEVA